MADWYKVSLTPSSASRLNNIREEEDDNDHGSTTTTKPQQPPLSFASRRSPVVCRSACVATSQVSASRIGYDILKQGGNAADTAIAIAATLAVTEPCSTGLGGDMFCLYYTAQSHQVSCINGSGRSPHGMTWDRIQQAHPATAELSSLSEPPRIDADRFRDSALSVTIPGAAQGWYDLYQRHGSGRFTFAELLEPAAQLAEQGFPVAPITAFHWSSGMSQITKWLDTNDSTQKVPLTTPDGHAPEPGNLVYNPDLARVLRDLGAHGPQQGFYQGRTGQAIVGVVQSHGGCLTLEDLAQHTTSDFPTPISATYRNMRVWQVPPNGQGIAGLIALTAIDELEKVYYDNNTKNDAPTGLNQVGTADAYHLQIEMMRLGFAYTRAHVADATCMTVSTDVLLDRSRIATQAKALYHPHQATIHGVPDASSCTVSFQVVDAMGNAISFVNSNFMGFGTGLVPKDCGFTLQNRGFGFSLDPNHVNAIAPNKRPYHTIIPAILTHANNDDNEFYATLSNMGGNMQPQGHMQLTMDLVAGQMDPQAAIDMPRFCIVDGSQDGKVYLEEGVDPKVVEELKQRGHLLVPNVSGHERSIFGRAQIIVKDPQTGVLWAGSDGRADGCAMGY